MVISISTMHPMLDPWNQMRVAVLVISTICGTLNGENNINQPVAVRPLFFSLVGTKKTPWSVRSVISMLLPYSCCTYVPNQLLMLYQLPCYVPMLTPYHPTVSLSVEIHLPPGIEQRHGRQLPLVPWRQNNGPGFTTNTCLTLHRMSGKNGRKC